MRPRSPLLRSVATAVTALVALAPLAGCGDDAEGDDDASGTPDVETLCDDVLELQTSGRRAGEVFGAPDVTDAQARAAVTEVIERTRAVLDGLPDRLATDRDAVADALDGIEGRLDTATVDELRDDLPDALGGLLTDPTASEAGAGRILQYVDSVCELPE